MDCIERAALYPDFVENSQDVVSGAPVKLGLIDRIMCSSKGSTSLIFLISQSFTSCRKGLKERDYEGAQVVVPLVLSVRKDWDSKY